MPITALQANTVVVPLEVDTAIATRAIKNREYTLVRVTSDNGTEGYGFCYGGSHSGHLSTTAARDLLRQHVVGKEYQDTEPLWNSMFRDSVLHGRRGSVLRAMSAIDNAIWDLKAKEAGLPLYKLLGAPQKETVPAYASGGYYLKGKTVSELADEMRKYVAMGFPAVKIKVGLLDAREDAERVKACREAIGPDIELFLDVNNAWKDKRTAIESIKMFEEYNPGWIEEPVMPDEVKMSAEIATAIDTPVSTGEIEATRWGFERLIDYRAASILQPDAAVCGGITEFIKIAKLAEASEIPISPHWFADLHVHMVAATANAIWVEFFTDATILNFMKLLKKSVQVRDGRLLLPQEPGMGIEFDNELVDRYSKDGWR
jgi:L-alanine-DL-glutamate epimerase-like enolase superfamily enzyme